MTAISNLKVYATHAHACSYLADEQATTLFVDPDAEVDRRLYCQLAELGFRRSGNHIYRPHCANCQACIAVRVPVNLFTPRRQQRKIWNRNQDLNIEISSCIDGDEYYSLYEQYINIRHHDGDMYPPSREQYQSFLTCEWGMTEYYCFRENNKLVAVAVADVMDNGLAAVYTFFDPQKERRSLGIFAVLWQIERAKHLKLPYVYLGYWIKECRKMNYKTDYRPLEMLIEKRWLQLN